MKKALLIFLSALLLLTTLCACGSDDTATPDEGAASAEIKVLTPEEAVQIYYDKFSIWGPSTDEAKWLSCFFLDLDFDSNLELLVTYTSAVNQTGYYKFYKLDTENNSIFEIPFPDKETNGQWTFGGDYPQLYKNNATGDLKYVVYNNIREGATAGSMCIGEMTMDATSNICAAPLWSFTYSVASYSDASDSDFHYYTFDEKGNKNEVDEETYDSTLSSYEENNTNLNLVFKAVESNNIEYTFSELSQEEQFNTLLESYNAFSYSK